MLIHPQCGSVTTENIDLAASHSIDPIEAGRPRVADDNAPIVQVGRSDFPDTFRDRVICVMGLGYVGLTLAVVMAEVGFRVQGVEIRDDIVRRLAQGDPHIHEPGLAGRLGRVLKSARLTVSKQIPDGFSASVYLVTVGTPLA